MQRHLATILIGVLSVVPNINAEETPTGAAVEGLRFPEVIGRHVLVVGVSGSVSTNALETACSRIILMTRMPVKWDILDNPNGAAKEVAGKILKSHDVAALVLAMDGGNAPSLMAMPEQRIVILNPQAWIGEDTEPDLAERRTIKMLERGFCAVMGGTLAPVFSPEDLDKLRSGIAPSVMTSVFRYGRALSIDQLKPLGKQ